MKDGGKIRVGWGRKERGGYTGREGIRQTGREGDETEKERERKTVRDGKLE